MIKWYEERASVLEGGRKLVERGLVVGKAGNVSLRLPPDNGRELMAITPTSRYYESMSISDIPVVDFDGKSVEGGLAPSSELFLHAAIYSARSGVRAVVHTHSTYASAVAVAGLEIPAILEEAVVLLGGEVRVAGYAPSGTRELAASAVSALGDRNAVILANHGAVGVGKNIREALTVCEVLEKTAMIFLLTLALGKVNPLTPEAVMAARALFSRMQDTEDR